MNLERASDFGISGARSFDVRRGASNTPDYQPEIDRPDVRKLRQVLKHANPFTRDEEVNIYRLKNLINIWRGLWRILMARLFRLPHFYGAVYGVITRADGSRIDLGLLSLRVVTTAGVNKIVAGLNATDTSTFSTFKFHGFGTGTTAEASGDTALVTELTTQYNPDSTRPTGSQTVGASNNIYRTVGTLTPDSGGVIAVTEHGIFSASSAGTLLDRSKFSAINLDSAGGDSLQVTYDGTFAAGG